MKVVKNINNNVAVCLNSKGRECIVFGKGVGFIKPPNEISLDMIDRTFYDVDTGYLDVIAGLDEKVIDVAKDIVDFANTKLGYQYNGNVIFTLADHIQFVIRRYHENINLKLPLYYEVQSLYPEEIKVGMLAISLIENELDIKLPKEEAAAITLHLVGYGDQNANALQKKGKSIVEQCTEIVEREMGVSIDKKSFNYSRFVTHLYYLLDRVSRNQTISSENRKLFKSLKQNYPQAFKCAVAIRNEAGLKINDEELLYLILHINRLCSREDYE